MKMAEADRQLVLGALDSLGVALAEHDHEWTVGERTIYEEAIKVITGIGGTKLAVKVAIATKARSKP